MDNPNFTVAIIEKMIADMKETRPYYDNKDKEYICYASQSLSDEIKTQLTRVCTLYRNLDIMFIAPGYLPDDNIIYIGERIKQL